MELYDITLLYRDLLKSSSKVPPIKLKKYILTCLSTHLPVVVQSSTYLNHQYLRYHCGRFIDDEGRNLRTCVLTTNMQIIRKNYGKPPTSLQLRYVFSKVFDNIAPILDYLLR